MRIVIDTNVIISAVFFSGAPLRLIEHLFSGAFAAFASPQIIQEYTKTYGELHKKYSGRGNPSLFQKIIAKSNIIMPKRTISVCRDPDDNKFIECALAGKCVYIVSGDKDLLSLEKVEDVEIVTISDFLERFEKTQK